MLAKISACIAAATLLLVVMLISFTFPDAGLDDNPAVVLGAIWTFGLAAMVGIVLGTIGIFFAVGSFLRREPLTLGILALVLNLPVPVLGFMLLLRNLTR